MNPHRRVELAQCHRGHSRLSRAAVDCDDETMGRHIERNDLHDAFADQSVPSPRNSPLILTDRLGDLLPRCTAIDVERLENLLIRVIFSHRPPFSCIKTVISVSDITIVREYIDLHIR
nr:hypothetical protein [Brevibacterium sp. UCMA 11752]